MITFGTKLRVIRTIQNLKQTELAQKAKLQQYDISLFEADKAIPNGQTLQDIETALGVDFDAPHIEQAFQVLAGELELAMAA